MAIESERNLETILQNVNRFINIDNYREAYSRQYEYIRNKIHQGLQKMDPLFESLANGHTLGGSYADNLKISKPDEYDLLVHIKVPAQNFLIVTPDDDIPGNVQLNLSNIFDQIKNQKHHAESYKALKSWVDCDGYLLEAKLQSWIQSCFYKLLRSFEYSIMVFNTECSMRYKKNGPAHTIYIKGVYNFSIDFVPSILIPFHLSVLPKNNQLQSWEAIPKPLKPYVKTNKSFRASYNIQESKLIEQKYNLKNALRLMKKFRDTHNNLQNLKSYYIKTVFMLKAESCDDSFWIRPLNVILVEMFKLLENHLECGEIFFYWNRQLNLLKPYNRIQIQEMHFCIRNANKILISAASNLNVRLTSKTYCLFLTNEERCKAGVRRLIVVEHQPEDMPTMVETEPEKTIAQSDKWCTIL